MTNLVEYPTALKGKFSEDFLALPEELLNLTMKQHQRYFPMRSIDEGKIIINLLPFPIIKMKKN